ncbi:DUF3667 domain-containing protein [Muricauda sp. JGD-17]|uniref:DUF3667 domain-containing protein n=1 Tax=Flagellimonas ochracea TaxID=2696472 RepID=A0A964TF66_9FLAO|nr:DUF3667 domain-containing protein [Allomuricauda ochracea]NAY93033.1 DUF3667 domain-containing protein [Allomuricauda ochracea]
MVCKNCDAGLQSNFDYCPSCGAKIIRNRLTFKNVMKDVSVQLLSLDNTFLKTFRHMFLQPHEVIESYVSGIRKKYMNPISYFAIAITLSGLLFFVLRNVYNVDLTQNSFSDVETSEMDFLFDYQGVLAYLIMPIYALMTWLFFLDRKKFNYTEHLVANAYIIGQLSFVQILICLPLFGFFSIPYDIFNWIFTVITVTFQFFVLKKIHQTGVWSTLLRGLGYLILLVVVMLAMGMLIVLVGLLTGIMNIEDFRPQV